MNKWEEHKNLLHTPEGVRDIFGKDCEGKLGIEASLHKTLKLYGFQDIQTPSFEFFDVFSEERGTVSSRDMFKFFDKENNTLVLRPDITPSIARCVGKYFADEDVQVRLCYLGNTYTNGVSYQGRLKEVTQVGAELINDASTDADAEMVALTIECLQKAGLEEFQIDIGHADFLEGLVEEAKLTKEEAFRLTEYIERKNLFGVEEMVSEKEMGEALKELIRKLPELFGDIKHLAYAKERTKSPKAREAIRRLEDIYSCLEIYGLESYVNFDLGMLSQYGYYTGIIFKAYTYGTGDAVAKGGRYDALMGQFGKDAPAIGVAIVADQLVTALDRQKIKPNQEASDTMILYHEGGRKMAISLAGQFRADGASTRLVRKFHEKELEDYKEYGKRNGFGGILYIEGKDAIQVVDLVKGTSQTVNPMEIMRR